MASICVYEFESERLALEVSSLVRAESALAFFDWQWCLIILSEASFFTRVVGWVSEGDASEGERFD